MITISTVHIQPTCSYKFFFLVMRPFKIYSFSTFQMHNTVLLTIITMLHITSSELIYLVTGNFLLLDHLHPFCHLIHFIPHIIHH